MLSSVLYVWSIFGHYGLIQLAVPYSFSLCVHLNQQGQGLATQTGTKLHDDDAVQLKISLEMWSWGVPTW